MGRDKYEAMRRKPLQRKASGEPSGEPAPPLQNGAFGPSRAASFALRAMASDSSGWLRVVSADEGKTVYLKWKWTAGELKNRYVMAVGSPDQLDELLLVLERKRVAAEAGEGPTAADRWYKTE